MNNIKTEDSEFDAESTKLLPEQLNWRLSQCDAMERDAGDACHSNQSLSSWQEPKAPQVLLIFK